MRSRYSVAIIITVVVLLELISFVQLMFARKGIRDEVVHRAETELLVKNLEIRNVMVAVETAMANTLWTVEHRLQWPDSLYVDLRRMLEQNSTVVGVGLMFTPNYYPQKGRWYEPYVVRLPNGVIEKDQIGSAHHNYLEMEFYKSGISAGKGRWSEPYFDEAGAQMMLSTYTLPIRDGKGKIVGLVGADVSLEWLSDVINHDNYQGL